eukprot:7388020-Prymnesium_polylepis.1
MTRKAKKTKRKTRRRARPWIQLMRMRAKKMAISGSKKHLPKLNLRKPPRNVGGSQRIKYNIPNNGRFRRTQSIVSEF